MFHRLIFFVACLSEPWFSEAVYGGQDVTNPHEFPWMARVVSGFPSELPKTWNCGGSIISNSKILTAAHCVLRPRTNETPTFINVIVGHSNISSEKAVSVPVRKILIHKGYNRPFPDTKDDLALLKLTQNLTFSHTIQPIRLPSKNHDDEDLIKNENSFFVAGWGQAIDNVAEKIANLGKYDLL